MIVKWWGHACFEVESNLTIVFDPHVSGIGDFLKGKPNVKMLRADSFEVRAEDLPEKRKYGFWIWGADTHDSHT
jgi:L-ascorbate metabolism protein UlaG (beta-lactamase superfamily)